MAKTLTGFFQCVCGKMHAYAGITEVTKCTCGMPLFIFLV